MKHVSHIIVVDFYTFSYNPVRLSDATYRMDLYKNFLILKWRWKHETGEHSYTYKKTEFKRHETRALGLDPGDQYLKDKIKF